jgi:hypothetical protein
MRLRLYLSEVYDAIAAYAQSRGYSGRQITHAVIKFMPEKNSGMTCVEIDVDRHPAATETKAPATQADCVMIKCCSGIDKALAADLLRRSDYIWGITAT